MTTNINLLNEVEQIKAVRQDGYAIQFIKNPTEAVQIAALVQLIQKN